MNYRPQKASDDVQLGTQSKPIMQQQQQQQQPYQAYQSQRPDAYNVGQAPQTQYTQPNRPNMYQSNAQPQNPTYSQFNAPQPTQQPPTIRPMVQPSPNMNFRPNNGPEMQQYNTSPQKGQTIQFNQPRVETRPQFVQPPQQSNQPASQYQPAAPQQYKPQGMVQQNYNPMPQVSQAVPIVQTRPMPNMPAKAYVDDGEEDGVISGRMNTPPIASIIQLAGYQNGTQSARPMQAPRPQAIQMAKRSDSLRSLSSSPEPKFNTISSPDQIYSPTLRQSPTQPSFERMSSPEQQQQQPHRVVQFQQPPERPLHFDPNQQNRQPNVSPPKVFSPEPQTHQGPNIYQRTPVHPTTLDLGQTTKHTAYSPVSLNNLITPTRQAQSPGVTFRLPEETEGRNEARKRPDTLLKQQVLTPTTETFRRSPMATTPENYPRASNWVNRPRSVDRRYSELF